MKIAATIARLLLGLIFLVFGLNDFLHFIPMGTMPPRPAGQFAGLLMSTHYMNAVGLVMVVSGALLLVNRYVPLGLVLLGPVLVNILLFHVLMQPKGVALGVLATILWILVAIRVRSAFYGLFQQRVQD
jgi:putative oxidoreductase